MFHDTSYHSLQCSCYIISQPAVFMVHHITACSVHGTSYHSLQCSCLNVLKVAIDAIFNSSLLQLLSTPRLMTLMLG